MKNDFTCKQVFILLGKFSKFMVFPISIIVKIPSPFTSNANTLIIFSDYSYMRACNTFYSLSLILNYYFRATTLPSFFSP